MFSVLVTISSDVYIYIYRERERERESTYKQEMLDSMREFLFHGNMKQMGYTQLFQGTQFHWLLSTWRERDMRRSNLLLCFGKVVPLQK